MKTNITKREWEALSAYMDGQLSPAERMRLESQLKQRQDLVNALQDLRRTRAIVRAAPRHRAPRNFVLTESMVGVRRVAPRTFSLFSTLKFASVVASFLFILVFVGDLWMASRVSQQTALEAAQAPMELAQQAQSEPSLKSGATEESAVTPEVEAPAALMAPPVLSGTPYPEVTMEAMVEAGGGVIDPALSDRTTQNYPAPDDAFTMSAPAAEPAPQPPIVNMWRLVEVILALTAIGAGVVAFWLWRAGRA